MSECEEPQLIKDLRRMVEDIENLNAVFVKHERRLSGLQVRLEKLERHHNYQIDENRKISRRVDELEQLVSNLSQKKDVSGLSCPWCNGTGKQRDITIPCGNKLNENPPQD